MRPYWRRDLTWPDFQAHKFPSTQIEDHTAAQSPGLGTGHAAEHHRKAPAERSPTAPRPALVQRRATLHRYSPDAAAASSSLNELLVVDVANRRIVSWLHQYVFATQCHSLSCVLQVRPDVRAVTLRSFPER